MSIVRFISLVAVCLCFTACASQRVPQQLQQGKISFQSGSYKQAYHELLPLAMNGNADAEYAIGYMYYYGMGVEIDGPVGVAWMQKAADQHHAEAIAALAMIKKGH